MNAVETRGDEKLQAQCHNPLDQTANMPNSRECLWQTRKAVELQINIANKSLKTHQYIYYMIL